MPQDILKVSNLRTTFHTKLGPLHAVNGISYSVKKGEVLGIVGESGCGKSITSLSIMGLIDPPGTMEGAIFFQGKNLLEIGEKKWRTLRGHKMAMIFQEPMVALNPVLKVGEQIEEPLREHLKLKPKEAKDRAIEMLQRVGIPSPKKRYASYPHQLSGGMRQRAMIAMALSCEPDFLIADEPTTALDVTIQAQILELLQDIQEQMGMTIQFITHDLGVISEIADSLLIMYAGQICETGPADEIFRNPQHPYTIALLESIPHMNEHKKRLYTIEGQVPDILNRPQGCPFQNRCPKATGTCQKNPPLEEVSPEHLVACFHRGPQ